MKQVCYCPPQKVIPIKDVSVIHRETANIYGAVLKTQHLKATGYTHVLHNSGSNFKTIGSNLESLNYFGCSMPYVWGSVINTQPDWHSGVSCTVWSVQLTVRGWGRCTVCVHTEGFTVIAFTPLQNLRVIKVLECSRLNFIKMRWQTGKKGLKTLQFGWSEKWGKSSCSVLKDPSQVNV